MHDHGHGHNHNHDKALGEIQGDVRRQNRTKRALKSALIITALFMLVEAIAGWAANSLSLLGDAVHMLGDAGGLSLALLAVWVSTHPRSGARFRNADKWGALINGLWVLCLAGVLIYESVMRLKTLLEHGVGDGAMDPGLVVNGELALAVAVLGLFVNIMSLIFLRSGSHSDLNIRAAVLHVMVDLLGSFGAIIAGLVISLTGWMPIDPIVMLLIGGMISVGAVRVIFDSLKGGQS